MSAMILGHIQSVPQVLLVAAVISILGLAVRTLMRMGSRPTNMPPGPPTVPFFGNSMQVAGALYPHHIFTEWARKYGPLVTFMNGSQPWVIVSGLSEADEIFHKQGGKTSGRPLSRMELEMRSGYFPSFMTGHKWRVARKMWHAVLNVGASRQYLPLQQLEAKQLIADVAADGSAWRKHVDRYAGSVAMTMMNGQRLPSHDDPTAKQIVDDLAEFSVHSIRSKWIESFPIMWKLPEWAVPARIEAKKIAARHRELILSHWNTTKDRVAGGLSLPCFNKSIMNLLSEGTLRNALNEAEAAEAGEVLVTAATDTTSSSLTNWVAAMALHPDVQKKGQQEIDSVVGPDRLPDEDDFGNLPYVRQILQELHRWITAAPIGIFHATTEPFQWGPYLIPAGTPMIINSYGIHRDPATYHDPLVFNPERWAGKLESTSNLTDDRVGARSELFAFGAGRRICPGQHLAERSLILAISRWLWAFDIRKAKDEATGKEIDINMNDLRPGLVASLNDFAVDVKPRSERKVALVTRLWDEAKRDYLDEQMQWIKCPPGVQGVMDKAGCS